MNTGFVDIEATSIAAPTTPFPRMLQRHGLALARTPLEILQVNLTARCNLACTHCHVESGPKREEALDERGIDRLIELMSTASALHTLDLTGGAPELHPQFRRLVSAGRAHGLKVILDISPSIPYWGSSEPNRCPHYVGGRAKNGLGCYWKPDPRKFSQFVTAVSRLRLGDTAAG